MFFTILWQFPQLLFGLIVWFITSKKVYTKNVFINDNKTVWVKIGYCPWNFKAGLCLGAFVFVPEDADDNILLHESGHSIQSMYLGWFYLLIIGIPSFVWACLYKIPAINRRWSYYDFYTEKWADKIAGIKR